LFQCRRHGRLAFLGRQVKYLHIVAVGTLRILRLQRIVGPPERRRRIQVRLEDVASEGARLTYQPGDDVTVVDVVLVLPA